MLYEQLLMDSSTLLKFDIYRYLLKTSQGQFPITKLANTFELSYQQAVIELTTIDNDLVRIHPHHQSFMLPAGKVDCQLLSSTIDEYRYYLLNQSIPFQFILYFLTTDKASIDDFCTRYKVSRSTVSRKIATLKKHYQQFKLHFTYSEANLVGDERLVRISLFNVLWLATRGQLWPLHVSEKKAEKLAGKFRDYFPASQTFLGKLELKLFAGIFLARIQKKQFVKYDRRYNFLMNQNPYYDFDRLNPLLDYALTDKQALAESSFIFFLSHYAPLYIDESSSNLKQTIYDFSSRPNPVYQLTQTFLDYAKKEIFFSHPEILDNPVILGNLLNISFTFYVLQQPFPNLQRLVVPTREKSVVTQQLEEKVRQFFYLLDEGAFQFINPVMELIIKSYKNILMPYYKRLNLGKPLKIGIVMEHNVLLIQDLLDFLNALNFVEVSLFSTDEPEIDPYDLLIGSSLVSQQQLPDIPVYLWEYAPTDSQWVSLYQDLRLLYSKKNAAMDSPQ